MLDWVRRLFFGSEARTLAAADAIGHRQPRGAAELLVPRGAPGDAVRREFFNKLAGVSFSNSDGTPRQAVISRDLRAGMVLDLRLEDGNSKDPDAIAAYVPRGRQVGYLDSNLAAQIRGWIQDRGGGVTVTVTDITGGDLGRPTRGVNVLVQLTVREREEPPRMGKEELAKAITALKRTKKWAEAEVLLTDDLRAYETLIGRFPEVVVSGRRYEQLAILYAQQGRIEEEIAILNRYLSVPSSRRMSTERLQARLKRAISRRPAPSAPRGDIPGG